MSSSTERTIIKAEGGSVSLAERGGEYLVIINQAAMIDLLSEEDAEGIDSVAVKAFATAEERDRYLLNRYGWQP